MSADPVLVLAICTMASQAMEIDDPDERLAFVRSWMSEGTASYWIKAARVARGDPDLGALLHWIAERRPWG